MLPKYTDIKALAVRATAIDIANFLKLYFFTPAIIVTISVNMGTKLNAKIMIHPCLFNHAKLFS